MFCRTILVYLFGFILVKFVKMDPSITFDIRVEQSQEDSGLMPVCDHNKDKIEQNLYTVYEGEKFKIVAKYGIIINHVICHAVTDSAEKAFESQKGNSTKEKKEIFFTGVKRMGTLWKCKILAHQNNEAIKPRFKMGNDTYSVAYCYMRIHVRRQKPPQMIMVNNMQMQAARTKLSEEVDFIAEYPYNYGDEVEVICTSVRDRIITMEYMLAGAMSNQSTMNELKSTKMIGFTTRLHSVHEHSYMTCTLIEDDDYTSFRVDFVKQTNSNFIKITINGKVVPPYPTKPLNYYYEINYKYVINQVINVTCEVQRADLKFSLFHEEFVGKVKSYQKTELSSNRGATMTFYLSAAETKKKLECAVDYTNGGTAERVSIRFTKGDFPDDKYPLQMKLPSEGRVLELFNDYKLNVIFYEFQDDEVLQLTCGKLTIPTSGPVVYLQFGSKTCKKKDCPLSKNVTRNDTTVACYIKEEHDPSDSSVGEVIRREIRVLFRDRVLTTTTTPIPTKPTISTTTEEYKSHVAEGTTSTELTNGSQQQGGTVEHDTSLMKMAIIIGCSVVFIIIICASVVIIKLRKRNHSQGSPRFENLQEPSESSIPAHPPQWENNYAVPVDQRSDDTTYSVPCAPDLYATPTPKNLRNKKQKASDPTYAVLAVPNNRGQKNVFKGTEDPNYSEVYEHRAEPSYGKVLPKSQRNVEQDNPYSYVVNDQPLVFTPDSEPMYCEPGKARDADYANLNNSHYVNSNAPEYVEPTYCEPQKRFK